MIKIFFLLVFIYFISVSGFDALGQKHRNKVASVNIQKW